MSKTQTTKRLAARQGRKAGAAKPSKPKARPKPRKPKPDIVQRKLVWRGVLISIRYEPDSMATYSHLELRVVAPEGAPIPVTNTGYRSHFVANGTVKAFGGPVAWVRTWLDREAGDKAYLRALERWRQLDLFAD